MDVRSFLDRAVRVAAVTIDASKINGALLVRIAGVLMALDAAGALDVGLGFCLLAQIVAVLIRARPGLLRERRTKHHGDKQRSSDAGADNKWPSTETRDEVVVHEHVPD